MRTDLIARLNHMRDLGPSETDANSSASRRMRDVLNARGFRRLDTPIIEPTDLFVRKSGGEVSSSLYSFQDPGGMSVSLRPEFTPSIIRWFIENVSDPSSPHRYQYSGPVFRYAGPRRGRFRQFHQVGAELIGVSDGAGDAEILTTAIRCLRAAGLDRFTLRLGHIGMIHDIVESQGLSEQVEMFIVSNLAEIGARPDYVNSLTASAAAAGLVLRDSRPTPVTEDLDKAMPELEIVRRSISGPTGRRSPGRILARLSGRMKRACSRTEFTAALQNVARLVSLTGPASRVLHEAAAILDSNNASMNGVRALGSTLTKLRSEGVSESSIHLDLSFARGMTYYTGVVFEFLDSAGTGEYSIGGGGRYDDLVKAFGGDEMPACGFAMYIDEVVRTIQQGA